MSGFSDEITGLPEECIEKLLLLLQKMKLVIGTDTGAWVLAKDLSYVSLQTLYNAHPWVLPSKKIVEEMIPDERLFLQAIAEIEKTIKVEFVLSLESFLRGDK